MDSLTYLKENAVCCISGKPLKDCKHLNWVQLNMKASWSYPVWGNLITGDKQMAIAVVHDEFMDQRSLKDLVKYAIEVKDQVIKYHEVEEEWDSKTQGIDTSKFSPQSLERLHVIRKNCLLLFEQSFGWRFRVKGTPLEDVIVGVDHDLQMVKGKEYGDFHIDICELTSSTKSSISS